MTAKPQTFHVPSPSRRPGEKPDFSKLDLPPAGAAPRPDPLAPAAEARELATSLVRVLDDDHRAVGPWNPELDLDTLKAGLASMIRTRTFDERMQRLQRQGKTSFYVRCLGEEAVAVAAAAALRPTDMTFPAYRQQGLLIHRGKPLEEMAAQCIGNAADELKGRQLPVHYSARDYGVFSISGNLTTQFPQAVGWAMGASYRSEDQVTATWTGEGSSAEGDFHAACVLASVYRPPVILNVVNNQWAISMFQGLSGGQDATFASRAAGYGFPGIRVDGNDFLAVYAATQWAAERARLGAGATLLEIYTYRGEAHSTSDDPARYRPKDEWTAWPLGDPIARLRDHLIGLGAWSLDDHAALVASIDREVQDALRAAVRHGTIQDGPHAPVESMFEDVFVEPDWRLRRQRQDLGV